MAVKEAADGSSWVISKVRPAHMLIAAEPAVVDGALEAKAG